MSVEIVTTWKCDTCPRTHTGNGAIENTDYPADWSSLVWGLKIFHVCPDCLERIWGDRTRGRGEETLLVGAPEMCASYREVWEAMSFRGERSRTIWGRLPGLDRQVLSARLAAMKKAGLVVSTPLPGTSAHLWSRKGGE